MTSRNRTITRGMREKLAITGLVIMLAMNVTGAGACGLLFIFLFTDRLAARARALARERDEKARRLA